MATQGKVQFREGYALDDAGVVSNVATNQAEMELWRELAANVDGKQIYPSEVTARRASFAEGMSVDGSSITLSDGVIRARHLVQSEQLITNQLQVGNAVITPGMISLPGGMLSALSANLGSISTGHLALGAGGVDIGSADAGISIIGNTLTMMYGGKPTIVLDGTTGMLTCNNFNFTTDNAPVGAVQNIDGGIQIGGTTRSVDDLIVSYNQDTAPTGDHHLGDIWVDTTDGLNTINIWDGDSWEPFPDGNASAAIAELANIASDNVLSKGEKGAVILDYNTIIAEQPGLDSLATSFGVTTQKTAYDNAVTALTSYLATLTTPTLWSNTSGDTTIVGSTFRSKFQDVYTARMTLIDQFHVVNKAATDSKAKTYYQSTAPTSGMNTGDLWIDSDDLTLWRYSGTNWTTQTIATGNRITAGTSAPTSPKVGDLWVDTTGGANLLKIWNGSSWAPYQDPRAATALQPGGGVVAPGPNYYITRINTSSGIVVSTSALDSGARTQITSAGMAIYDSLNQLKVQADHTYGIWVNNSYSSSPGTIERVSVAYSGVEKGWFGAWNTGACVACAGMLQLGAAAGDIAQTQYINMVAGGESAFSVSSMGIMFSSQNKYLAWASGPTITMGSGSPTGVQPAGSLYLSTYGSIWGYVALAGGGTGWKRIDNWTS